MMFKLLQFKEVLQ